MKVLLLTFGDGTQSWRDSARRLGREAISSNFFDSVEVFGLERLYASFPEFKAKHFNLVNQTTPGLGYWIWKPYLIHSLLNDPRWEFDILVYLDAGCSINSKTISSRNRFQEYCELASSSGGLFFEMRDQIERSWNKRATIKALDAGDPLILDSNQILGGITFFTRTRESIALAENWLQFSSFENYRLLNDENSADLEESSFRAHRHDQAILSLLVKKSSFTIVPDETYFPNAWKTKGANFPIWATRNGTAIPVASESFAWKVVRRIYRHARRKR